MKLRFDQRLDSVMGNKVAYIYVLLFYFHFYLISESIDMLRPSSKYKNYFTLYNTFYYHREGLCHKESYHHIRL